jgi:hypothetical protein
MRGGVYPPDAKKWRGVDYEAGQVCVDPDIMNVKVTRQDKGRRWVDFEKEDLKRLDPHPPPKFTHALAGIGCSGAAPMVSAKCTYNSAKALLGRAFRLPEARAWGRGPIPGAWEWAWQFVDYLLPEFRSRQMTIGDWLQSMPSRRRAALSQAAQKLLRVGWKDSYAKFSAFVKTELLPGFAKAGGDLVRIESMLDRLIQGPKDETHCIAGPWLKPLVLELKHCWSFDAPIFYGSAKPEALHKFLVERLVSERGLYFWSDFSMFDNTHTRSSWAFMRRLYQRAGIDDPMFWRVMDAWEKPIGSIGPFRYKARVMNASGRDDTALANGVLNGFATYLSVCAAWLNKPLFSLTVADVRACRNDIVLSVCGDDSIGRLPHMSEARASELRRVMATNISYFGFEAKLATSEKLYDAVYLGMRPYPTEKGYFWGKTIGRSTFKMGWVTMDKDRDLMAHITGVADMHSLCSRHVPVLSDLAEKIIELRQGAKRTPVQLDANKPWEWTFKSGVKYDEMTLRAVAETYSVRDTPGLRSDIDKTISVEDVKGLISQIQSVNRLPCVLDHWLWKHMVYCDDL